MVQALLDADSPQLDLVAVPFRFSTSMADMGRPGLGKVRALLRAVAGTWRARRSGATQLYYCVSGAERFPLWRDAAFLGVCRWWFRRTVYHFHAGGASEYLRRAASWERRILTWGIGAPDLGIKLSTTSPPDPEYFRARRVEVVPNGVGSPEDGPAQQKDRLREPGSPAHFLTMGKLTAAKGCFRLVDLVRDLRTRGLEVTAELVGQSDGPDTTTRLEAEIRDAGLEGVVRVSDPLQGQEKWEAFARADFFVFLTDFEHENVPLVILESMMCRLPVIASRWRGIPGLLEDGEVGTLVDLSSWPTLVDDVERALRDPERVTEAAHRARAAWEEHYTSTAYTQALTRVLAGRTE
jgi:glycosyltransferase involved in cell wall biosynthesis